MKKLLLLSAACLFVLGTFANQKMNSNQQTATKTTQTAPVKKTPPKTENRPMDKKDIKPAKKAKKAHANASK